MRFNMICYGDFIKRHCSFCIVFAHFPVFCLVFPFFSTGMDFFTAVSPLHLGTTSPFPVGTDFGGVVLLSPCFNERCSEMDHPGQSRSGAQTLKFGFPGHREPHSRKAPSKEETFHCFSHNYHYLEIVKKT